MMRSSVTRTTETRLTYLAGEEDFRSVTLDFYWVK